MNKEEFWNLIRKNKEATGEDQSAFLRGMEIDLASLEIDQILQFKAIMDEYVELAYVPGLWDAAAAMKNKCCSDDSFYYFRGWLIYQGKAVYLAALKNPDSLATADIQDDGWFEFESFLYVAYNAYEMKTGNEFPWDQTISLDESTKREIHSEIRYGAEIDKLHYAKDILGYLPQLCDKYLHGRDVVTDWPQWLASADKCAWGNARLIR